MNSQQIPIRQESFRHYQFFLIKSSQILLCIVINLFQFCPKELFGNKYLIVGRNAHKILIVCFMKEHI